MTALARAVPNLPGDPVSDAAGDAPAPNGTRDGALIQAVLRADDVLSAVAEAGPGGARLTDIARTTGLNKSTAHHLLRTLATRGFVERVEPRSTYRLGLRPFRLLWHSNRLHEIAERHREAMVRVCHRSGETVNLAIPYGDAALVAASLEGRGVARAAGYTGAVWPLHSTACGKVILAFSHPATRARLLAHPPERLAAATVVEPAALAAQIERVGEEAVAVEVEENEPGAACVAVPVFGEDGLFVGAVSVAGPVARMGPPARERIVAILREELGAATRSTAPPPRTRRRARQRRTTEEER